MKQDAPKLLDFLRDSRSLACRMPTARACGDWPGCEAVMSGWVIWGSNALGQDRTYRDPQEAQGDETDQLCFVRTRPITMRYRDDRTTSRDDFSCEVGVDVDAKINCDLSDLKAFCLRLLTDGNTLSSETLRETVDAKLRPVIRSFVRRHDAGDLVGNTCADAFEKHLCEGLAPFFFEAGLSLCGSPTLRCSSPHWSHQDQQRRLAERSKQQQALQQEMADCKQEAKKRRLDRLAEMLDRLQALADRSPNLKLADLVKTFSENERAEIYEALFKLRPPEQKIARVVVASAGELTFIDPNSPDSPARRQKISGEAGWLRSVQWRQTAAGRHVLMAGARNGVYEMGPREEDPKKAYLLGENGDGLKGGVNSVALLDNAILASYSEVGLIRWSRETLDAPEILLEEQTRNAEAIRHVRRIGDSIWLTVDHRVLRLPVEDVRAERMVSYEGNAIAITSLHVDGTRVLAGTQTGRIVIWDIDLPGSPTVLDHGAGRPVESVCLLPGRGLDRLVFADRSPGITARFLDDALACRYQGGGQELRRVVAADDLLAGVNTQRDRLFLWRTDEPSRPYASLPIGGWTGHSIQDVCFLPESAMG